MAYKIKNKLEGKRIALVWTLQITESKHEFCPANGYHGVSGKNAEIVRGFGSTEYALRFLNSEHTEVVETGYGSISLSTEPTYVIIHGRVSVKRPFLEIFVSNNNN